MTPLENEIVRMHGKNMWFNVSTVPYVLPNDVFIFDMHQLSDTNVTRKQAFREDIQTFLGLETELPQNPPHYRPGLELNATAQIERDAKKINICDAEYVEIRQELLNIGRLNQEWIRETFVNFPGVYHSSPEYFDKLIESWRHDPCEKRTATIQ
jgi:hypothetical protein